MIANSESMYRFLAQSTSKLFLTILLISGILLLCPNNAASTQSSEMASISAIAMSAPSHANGTDSGPSQSHSGFNDHDAVSPAMAISYLALLFFVAFAISIFATRELILAANWAYLTRLKYYQQRYRILIKPKLETLFKRWLNLLGGTVAISF